MAAQKHRLLLVSLFILLISLAFFPSLVVAGPGIPSLPSDPGVSDSSSDDDDPPFQALVTRLQPGRLDIPGITHIGNRGIFCVDNTGTPNPFIFNAFSQFFDAQGNPVPAFANYNSGIQVFDAGSNTVELFFPLRSLPASGRANGTPLLLDSNGNLALYLLPENQFSFVLIGLENNNKRFWVFFSGCTNVEYRIQVTDTTCASTRAYVNPQGQVFTPVQDTQAFATCP